MTSPSLAPLSDLMDDFAIAAMAQFIALYAPEKTEGPDATVQWCDHIAAHAPMHMAAAMMDARSHASTQFIA
jgi:hypothetical protein